MCKLGYVNTSKPNICLAIFTKSDQTDTYAFPFNRFLNIWHSIPLYIQLHVSCDFLVGWAVIPYFHRRVKSHSLTGLFLKQVY
jgi:hypothetical protein